MEAIFLKLRILSLFYALYRMGNEAQGGDVTWSHVMLTCSHVYVQGHRHGGAEIRHNKVG